MAVPILPHPHLFNPQLEVCLAAGSLPFMGVLL